MDEREVLLDQLEELLDDDLVDPEDALELAIVAGLAARLGAEGDALDKAAAWRDGPGRELLDEAWRELDADDLVDSVDAVMQGDVEDEEVEEALLDVDEIVAAAIWTGDAASVRQAALRVAASIRMVPDPFAGFADLGADMARMPAVAQHLDLYDFWLAVADAGAFEGEA